ncbi:MAG TPA: DUF1559 domain-containing protein [Gemmataceae bacterium]|jgi:hypothetical protein
MTMRALTRWGSGAAAVFVCVLLLALLTMERSLPADERAKAIELPADLAKIPNDGLILFSIRVAELWTGDFLKSVRGKHKEIADAAHEFEKRFGIALEQVERLTVAVIGPPPVSREPVMIVRTLKPYELAKVLAADANLKREAYKGQTLYVADKWSVYPLDDRSLVYSEFAAELRNLIDHPRPKERGALTDVLVQAAEKHTMVLGVNIKEYRDKGQLDQLPPGAEPFRPLSLARWAMLVVDVASESRLEVTAQFASEKDCGAATKAAQSGLDLLRVGLDQGIESLGKDKDAAALTSTLKQFKQPLKVMQVEQRGEMLQASMQAKVDPEVTGTVVMEGIQKIRESSSRTQSVNNLRQLVLAIATYGDSMKGRLPAQAIYSKDGKPLLSWRVAILPFIDQKPLYNEFHLNEAWDSEHNKKLLAKMPRLYASPHDEKTLQEHTTYYQGFVGKGAFFEGKQGVLYPAGFPDGLSNTIMFVEASKAVPWTKPEDLPFDPDKPLPKLGLAGARGFLAGMCDGSVRMISHKITQKTLRNAITRNDGEALGPDF